MSLKKEITDVLDALGATEQGKGRLVEYFVNRAALRDATLAGILKFVTVEDQAKARRA